MTAVVVLLFVHGSGCCEISRVVVVEGGSWCNDGGAWNIEVSLGSR